MSCQRSHGILDIYSIRGHVQSEAHGTTIFGYVGTFQRNGALQLRLARLDHRRYGGAATFQFEQGDQLLEVLRVHANLGLIFFDLIDSLKVFVGRPNGVDLELFQLDDLRQLLVEPGDVGIASSPVAVVHVDFQGQITRPVLVQPRRFDALLHPKLVGQNLGEPFRSTARGDSTSVEFSYKDPYGTGVAS